MKRSIVLAIVGLILLIVGVRGCVVSNYNFENKYSYAWELADKSSTIEAKCKYINEFVNVISSNRNDFADYNAIRLVTKNNSFDYNLKAITTLRDRLNEIKDMDITSFQYNTAIQQVTSQEQGEARYLISVIEGCYCLKNYPYIWDWIGLLLFLGIFILFLNFDLAVVTLLPALGVLLITQLLSPWIKKKNLENLQALG